MRDALNNSERSSYSVLISRRIVASAMFNEASAVLAYMPIGSEVDIRPVINEVVSMGKTLVLPKINREEMSLELYEVQNVEGELLPGPFGTSEPQKDPRRRVELSDIDLAVVPGLAFTAAGARLGYGGGFYDRLFENRPEGLWLVSPAFSIQVVKAIQVRDHDVSIDSVITEQREYESSRLRRSSVAPRLIMW